MKRKEVIVAVLALVVVAGVFGPAAFAAKTNGKVSGKQQLLDPFTLQMLVLDDNGTGGNALRVTAAELTRQAIRIPQRPPMRSAFRPSY